MPCCRPGCSIICCAPTPTPASPFACGPAAQEVFSRMPRLDRLIVLEKRRLDAHWLRLWWQVSTALWDLVVDLRGSALSFAVPARRRAVMRGGRRPGHRLTHLAGVLKLNPPPMPVVWTLPEDRSCAERAIPPGPAVIGLGPTANWVGKIWPAERFVALFESLLASRPGLRAAVFSGAGALEIAAAAPVLAAIPGSIDLTGRLTLPQAAACLARCALFVGNDSGLMHLAAAAGTPTLGLFGPTPASEYAPSGRCTAYVEADGPPGKAPIANLSVQTALDAANHLLALSTA